MNEKPILFSTPMVQAILEGRKTQTRRVIKPQPPYDSTPCTCKREKHFYLPKNPPPTNHFEPTHIVTTIKCPFQFSEQLWVRETHYLYGHWIKNGLTKTGKQKWSFKGEKSKGVLYQVDNLPKDLICTKKDDTGWFKRPSIFMPRWASRITLEVTEVRVQRLNQISMQDSLDEGVDFYSGVLRLDPRELYAELWDKINGKKYPWDSNPWVWAITFKRI